MEPKTIHLRRLVVSKEDKDFRDSLLDKFTTDLITHKDLVNEMVQSILQFRATVEICLLSEENFTAQFDDSLDLRRMGLVSSGNSMADTLLKRIKDDSQQLFSQLSGDPPPLEYLETWRSLYDCVSLFHRLVTFLRKPCTKETTSNSQVPIVSSNIVTFQEIFFESRKYLPYLFELEDLYCWTQLDLTMTWDSIQNNPTELIEWVKSLDGNLILRSVVQVPNKIDRWVNENLEAPLKNPFEDRNKLTYSGTTSSQVFFDLLAEAFYKQNSSSKDLNHIEWVKFKKSLLNKTLINELSLDVFVGKIKEFFQNA